MIKAARYSKAIIQHRLGDTDGFTSVVWDNIEVSVWICITMTCNIKHHYMVRSGCTKSIDICGFAKAINSGGPAPN